MRRVILIFLLSIISIGNAYNNTYYVKSFEGTSKAPCSLSRPCTFKDALEKARSGGTILIRQGHYKLKEPIYINTPSDRQNYLTIRNTPNEAVILSGKELSGKSADGGLINISSQNYLRIEGLHFVDYKSRKSNGTIAGILIKGKAKHIELLNNHIYNLRALTPERGTSALGIAIYGIDEKEPVYKVLVAGNEIHDLTLGFSEALTLAGNVEGFLVQENTLYNLNNIGIDIAGAYGHVCWQNFSNRPCDKNLDYARKGRVINNLVYNIDTRTNPAYLDREVNAAAGIYLDGSRHVLVANNSVYGAGVGVSVSSENKGGLASNIALKNNLISYNWRTGISLGAENAYKGKVKDCYIIGNTLMSNDESAAWGGELYMEYKVRNCQIIGNTFYANNFAFEATEGTVIPINLLINDFLNPAQSGNVNNSLAGNIYLGIGQIGTWFWQGNWYNHDSFEGFCEQTKDLPYSLIDFSGMLAPCLKKTSKGWYCP